MIYKWIATIKISWSNTMAYRLNFFLQVIGPSVVFLFIKYSIWKSIYNEDLGLSIAGFNFQEMIQYHSWVFIVTLISQVNVGMGLAEDIRLGKISTYLIYPFNFWEFHTANFIGILSVQVFVAFISFISLYLFDFVGLPSLPNFTMGLGFCLMVSFFWFTIQFLTGLLAFWLEETWVIRVIVMFLGSFFSGAILPLDFFPEWFRSILELTPFPYMTYYPIKMITEGYFNPMAILTISLWTLVFVGGIILTWKKGLKEYTAAGI